MKKISTILLIISLTVFLACSQRIIPPLPPIGNSGPCCQTNVIQVSGEGRASATADVAVINLAFDQKGNNSAEAVKRLSSKVTQALGILTARGVNSDSIQTGSLNVYPDYNYKDGRNQIVGQRATQSLTVKLRNVDPKGQRVGTLVDALAAVNSIKIDSITFDIFDKTGLQSQARASAFKDAKKKAEDYAMFADLQIRRVLKIQDLQYVQAPPRAYSMQTVNARAYSADRSTAVPIGELDVNYRVVATFTV